MERRRGYQRSTHKFTCKCPVCKSFRGERKKSDSIQICFSIPIDLLRELDDVKNQTGFNKAAIVRDAIFLWLRTFSTSQAKQILRNICQR